MYIPGMADSHGVHPSSQRRRAEVVRHGVLPVPYAAASRYKA